MSINHDVKIFILWKSIWLSRRDVTSLLSTTDILFKSYLLVANGGEAIKSGVFDRSNDISR